MKYLREKDFIVKTIKQAYKKFAMNGVDSVTQKTEFDLVTDIDVNIERYITEAILKEFPSDRIHGEEESNSQKILGRTWTIDPIDGTCNMAGRMPLYGVQCALFENNILVLSAIFLPNFDELMYAVKDEGCYLNDERVYVKKNSVMNNALVSFGDYPHSKSPQMACRQHNAIGKLFTKIAKIRMYGAACIDFAFVASGRTDATVVITKNIWDIAPGILACREAGAIITNLDGNDFAFGDEGVIISCNGAMSQLIVDSFDCKLNLFDKKYYGFIFDFDGVIIDTEKYHLMAWNRAAAEFGVQLVEDEYMPLKSTGRKNIVDYIAKKVVCGLSEKQEKYLCDKKSAIYEDLIKNITLKDFIPGVRLFLNILRKRGVKIAVASSSLSAEQLAVRLGIRDLFDYFIDGHFECRRKPSPDLFNKAAKEMGISKDYCIVFEDSVVGIEAAFSANIDSIAIGGLKHEIAKQCVNNFLDLLKLID